MSAKLIKGDKVEVISGEYKGAIGYISSILGSFVVVQPDENADKRTFDEAELKVIERKPRIKVIFLDFDGVLNSSASFRMEHRKRKKDRKSKLGPVNETFCHVCASNFSDILELYPEVKIVLSTTWRNLFEMDWLKAKLDSYGIDSSRVIGKTPKHYSGYRGSEIDEWLDDHPEVTNFVIIDDNADMEPHMDRLVQTHGDVGLTLPDALKVIQKLKGKIND